MYFTFKEYLSEAEQEEFFDIPHEKQVEKVKSYLDYLSDKVKNTQGFNKSSKASKSWATLNKPEQSELLDEKMLGLLVKGQTRSGFGALGTEEGFLPQKELSLAVANMVEIIGHEYQVEQSSKKKSKPVLNSRSFFFYWCHAEKQKLMDIHQKLIAQDISPAKRIKYWSQICIHVDREMCKDCVSFVKSFAQHQNASICIKDPSSIRVFTAEQVVIEKKNSL